MNKYGTYKSFDKQTFKDGDMFHFKLSWNGKSVESDEFYWSKEIIEKTILKVGFSKFRWVKFEPDYDIIEKDESLKDFL